MRILKGALAALIFSASPAMADAVTVRHGLSAFGDLKYGPDFEHFDYANPDAPKGGEIRTTPVLATQTFDSLNGYILKGDSAEGVGAPFNWLFDTLMVSAADEPDAMYGLVASHVELPEGREWAIFEMREQARFSDGSPLTAHDVVFTFAILKEDGHPAIKLSLRDVETAEALDDHRIRFDFAEGAPMRDLPMLVAGLPIFSKAYYSEVDFTESTLDPPLGSGPYKVGSLDRGAWIEYERREDYWAADLPVNRGRFNFDTIRYDYFRDHAAALEALVAGQVDLREEFFSKQWATRYDFPAIRDGRVLRDTLADERPAGTQGYWLNTRRDVLSDPLVREAIGLLFDFEWSNKQLFYGLYYRTDSYFENAPFEAEGTPSEAELTLLEPFRDALPESVFGEAYVPPTTNASGRIRGALRQARRLLEQAGWTVVDGVRVNADGEPLEIEFLDDSPSFARITNPFIQNLEQVGIKARLRQIDRPQYERRRKAFDFDIVTARFNFSLTPGPELRNLFSAEAAGNEGSFNLAGIEDPAVDALIEAVIGAEDRAQMEVALSALDRLLRSGFYWVPQWSKASHTIAYWDKFARPEIKPQYARGILDLWWEDADKAAALERR